MKDLNKLVEIRVEDWPKLRDLYVNRKSESVAYNMIQNYISWRNKDPYIDFVKIFSLNGDWSDGTFIIQDSTYNIFANTQNKVQDRLIAALDCLDKKPARYFSGFPERLKGTFDQISNIKYQISPHEALKFDIAPPEGVTLSSLRFADIDTINSLWPHRYEGSEKFIERLITFNPSIGAYDKDGNIISWCLQQPIGALGVLHVKEEHKRKGFGSLMVRVLSKILAEKGIQITATVVQNNVASKNLFEKLGFQKIDKVYWLSKPEFN